MQHALRFQTFEISTSRYEPDFFTKTKYARCFKGLQEYVFMEHFHFDSRIEGKQTYHIHLYVFSVLFFFFSVHTVMYLGCIFCRDQIRSFTIKRIIAHN